MKKLTEEQYAMHRLWPYLRQSRWNYAQVREYSAYCKEFDAHESCGVSCCPLCTFHQKEKTPMQTPTVTHPYYIGNGDLVRKSEQDIEYRNTCDPTKPYTRASFEEAVGLAEKRLAKDSNLEHVTIVKIVAVVRRKPPVVPQVDVEYVK